MQEKNKYRKCPICEKVKPILHAPATSPPPQNPSQIQITEQYFGLHGDLVKCRKCGFSYIGNNEYVKKLKSLYKKMSDEVYIQEEKERILSFKKILQNIEQLRGGKKGKLLDVGCCSSALLSQARKRGWQISGIDPSFWAAKMSKKLHNIKIHRGTLDTFKYKKYAFDGVTVLDVIEHVDDPKKMLKKINMLIKKQGILCIVTPDYSSLTAKILGKKWWGIRLAHISYFRKKDIERLVKISGFEIIKSRTYVRYFTLYFILVRILPWIEKYNIIKKFLKKITVPLIFFDTFELYLKKIKD